MAYSESKKLTSTEKRLQAIKAQLYGKEDKRQVTTSQQPHSSELKPTSPILEGNAKTPLNNSDTGHLKQDLIKIFILAALAIGSELALYFAFNNHTLSS